MELPEMPDEAVDERLREMQAKGPLDLPDVPNVDALERRTTQARTSHNVAKAQEASRLASDSKASKGLGVGLAIAYTLLGLPMAGLGIGFLVDHLTGSNGWKGIGTVVGAVAGIAFAVMMLNRENSRL